MPLHHFQFPPLIADPSSSSEWSQRREEQPQSTQSQAAAAGPQAYKPASKDSLPLACSVDPALTCSKDFLFPCLTRLAPAPGVARRTVWLAASRGSCISAISWIFDHATAITDTRCAFGQRVSQSRPLNDGRPPAWGYNSYDRPAPDVSSTGSSTTKDGVFTETI
ncbi:MAG: hypothetical protein MMC23_000939 [Stictis urceolatum]|nr:hypothetical protein [Stictis urceolata]